MGKSARDGRRRVPPDQKSPFEGLRPKVAFVDEHVPAEHAPDTGRTITLHGVRDIDISPLKADSSTSFAAHPSEHVRELYQRLTGLERQTLSNLTAFLAATLAGLPDQTIDIPVEDLEIIKTRYVKLTPDVDGGFITLTLETRS